MQFLGIEWVGVTPENGHKLLLSVVFIAIVLAASWLLCMLAGLVTGRSEGTPLPA